MVKILFNGTTEDWPRYKTQLLDALLARGINADLTTSADNAADFDYIIHAPNGPIQDFTPFVNVKLVQNLWAGVEAVITNKTLSQPLARMVDTGMTEGMIAYVAGHVLRHHLDTDRFARAQIDKDWQEMTGPPLMSNVTVGMLGLGALGLACIRSCATLGFKTIGWSRSQKHDDLVTCYAGEDGLRTVLENSDILCLLLPKTPQTDGLLNKARLGQMKKGASIINPGRGPLIDDDALIEALNSGHISQATLDVFNVEPLPNDHPYWEMQNVLVTPHVASETRIETAIEVIAQNIENGEKGSEFLHLVDPVSGY